MTIRVNPWLANNDVADLCEIFTGPYFHVGFDEAWNSGTCPVCRALPVAERD